jgi:hypothetical protein
MLIRYQGNKNGKYNEITCILLECILPESKSVYGCGEIVTPMHCQWERKIVQQLWKTLWKFLKN